MFFRSNFDNPKITVDYPCHKIYILLFDLDVYVGGTVNINEYTISWKFTQDWCKYARFSTVLVSICGPIHKNIKPVLQTYKNNTVQQTVEYKNTCLQVNRKFWLDSFRVLTRQYLS